MSGILGRRVFDQGARQIAGLGGGQFIKSIQHATITTTGTTDTGTATISAVDTANSILYFDGASAGNTSGATVSAFRVVLTNSTTVTATRNTSSAVVGTIKVTVVKYYPNVIRSIQSGSDNITGGGFFYITAVDTAKTLILPLGYTSTTDSGWTWDNSRLYYYLSNSTTVIFTKDTANTSEWVVYFSVVEFY